MIHTKKRGDVSKKKNTLYSMNRATRNIQYIILMLSLKEYA